MSDGLASLILGIGWSDVLAAAGLFLATFAASLAAVAFLLVKAPADFFVRSRTSGGARGQRSLGGWSRKTAKNVIGAGLVALGLVLSVPLVPGQGLLTILIGVMLLDFPGKRRLERALLRRRRVLQSVNHLRRRYGKPPLQLDGAE
jgi:hypothetical protein